MAIASASSPAWLHTLAQIASVILVVELLVVLLIVCALMLGLALGMRWLHERIIPIVQENVPRAQHAMDLTQQNTDRVVHGVAEFYGRSEAVRTGLRALLFGRRAAERAHGDSRVQAATDLQLISGGEPRPRTGNGFTPHPDVAGETHGHTSDQPRSVARASSASDERDDSAAGNAG